MKEGLLNEHDDNTLLLYVIGSFVISMISAGRHSLLWACGRGSFMKMFFSGTFVVWGRIPYEIGSRCRGSLEPAGRFDSGRNRIRCL